MFIERFSSLKSNNLVFYRMSFLLIIYNIFSVALIVWGAGDMIYMLISQQHAGFEEIKAGGGILSDLGKAILAMATGLMCFFVGVVTVNLNKLMKNNSEQ